MRSASARRVVVLIGITVVALTGSAAIAGTATAAAAPGPASPPARGRDPLQWPFARTSIWNTPIGRQARYVPARLRASSFGVAVDRFVLTRPPDPALLGYLRGDGMAPGHCGSGISSIGGSIRAGELTGLPRIRHALKLEVPARYLFDDPVAGGARWPAVRTGRDAARRYTGTVEALRMGALLALPPQATAAGLGIRSAAGRRLLATLRDYGAYVTGDSGLDDLDLCVEHRAAVEYARTTGHALDADPALRADVMRMVEALAVVDDNGPASVGGHGARRAAWAPAFATTGPPVPSAGTYTTPSPFSDPAVTGAPTPAIAAIKAAQVADVEPASAASGSTIWALGVAALGLLAAGLWAGRRLAGG